MNLKIPYAVIFLIFLFSCKKEAHNSVEKSQTSVPEPQRSVQKKTPEIPLPKIPKIDSLSGYSVFLFPKGKKDSARKAFRQRFTEEQQTMIFLLNRLDKKNSGDADTLIIPNKFQDSFIAYSPFPARVPKLDSVQKLVVFSYPIQAYGVYEHGVLLKWGPTSMGKKSAQTKRGLMFTNWKKELSTSSVNDEWKLPYNFNIHNTLGIGWHQYDLPGYPASHSCLRLTLEDAKWLYKFADQWILDKSGNEPIANGTPVIVYGDYAWGKRKPWRYLPENPNANTISEEQLDEIISPYLEKILSEQKRREEVIKSLPPKQPQKIPDSISG